MAVNISGIKSAFKTIFDAANTTTADYDLSAGLQTRVQRVLKVNPSKIAIQASLYPYVTCYANEKPIELTTIAGDQLKGRRSAEMIFNVIGAVWDENTTDPDVDDADEDIEKLMENVEEVLRRNFKLNNTVQWTKPDRVTYHTAPIADEDAHLRIGWMQMIVKVDY